MMKLTDFYYDLPQELIAQDPLLKRSESRLMVLDRKDNTISGRLSGHQRYKGSSGETHGRQGGYGSINRGTTVKAQG